MAASRAVEQVPWGRAWVGPAGAAEALPPLAAALAALAAANALCCAVAAVSYWRPLPAGAPGGVAFDPMGLLHGHFQSQQLNAELGIQFLDQLTEQVGNAIDS
ncbi:unnamed protein product [Prorocentrum cordatum]|uniref:Phospholipase B-like n=1 Tax=Prorocentrum cordatum TaxID=2364126 RepID=A0ABN9TQA5_9DINO|nr:unnamed protein product [Polarella glacialis]